MGYITFLTCDNIDYIYEVFIFCQKYTSSFPLAYWCKENTTRLTDPITSISLHNYGDKKNTSVPSLSYTLFIICSQYPLHESISQEKKIDWCALYQVGVWADWLLEPDVQTESVLLPPGWGGACYYYDYPSSWSSII